MQGCKWSKQKVIIGMLVVSKFSYDLPGLYNLSKEINDCYRNVNFFKVQLRFTWSL